MKNQNGKVDSNTIIIVSAIVVAALIIGGAVLTSNNGGGSRGPGVAAGGLDIGDAPVLGDADAPNIIVEFLDFQCPICEQYFVGIEPQIRSMYIDTGKAKLVYKSLTFIDSFDNNASPLESLLAARAGECAKRQGNFVAMHDAIYEEEGREASSGANPENSGNLTQQFFEQTARTIGLDVESFLACTNDSSVDDTLSVYDNDARAAMGSSVATPTVFINGTKLANPFDLQEYAKYIQ